MCACLHVSPPCIQPIYIFLDRPKIFIRCQCVPHQPCQNYPQNLVKHQLNTVFAPMAKQKQNASHLSQFGCFKSVVKCPKLSFNGNRTAVSIIICEFFFVSAYDQTQVYTIHAWQNTLQGQIRHWEGCIFIKVVVSWRLSNIFVSVAGRVGRLTVEGIALIYDGVCVTECIMKYSLNLFFKQLIESSCFSIREIIDCFNLCKYEM